MRSKQEWIDGKGSKDGADHVYEVTELYGLERGKTAILVHDNEDWTVVIRDDGSDAMSFYGMLTALSYARREGFIKLTPMQLKYVHGGIDITQVYDGKTIAEWINIGESNSAKHVHPKVPESEEQWMLYLTALVCTMTFDELLDTLGILGGM